MVGSFKPGKRLVVFTETQITVHKGRSRNITYLPAPLQLREEPKAIWASPGVGIRPDQHTDDPWAAVGYRNRLSKTGIASWGWHDECGVACCSIYRIVFPRQMRCFTP